MIRLSTGRSTAQAALGASDEYPAVRQRIREAIQAAAEFLPSQGPITVFVHHNTLHAFEELPFAEAVERAGQLYGCQAYMPESRYRQELAQGRILFSDLCDVLLNSLGRQAAEQPIALCSRFELQLAMLQEPLRVGPTEELRWFVAETDALRRVRPEIAATTRRRLIAETRRWILRDFRGGPGMPRHANGAVQALKDSVDLLARFGPSRMEDWNESTWEEVTLHCLWNVCRFGAAKVPARNHTVACPPRLRDLVLHATGCDSDLYVHELLIRFCAAFLDQGLARWPLPCRDEGFWTAFCQLFGGQADSPEPWLQGLSARLANLTQCRISPIRSIWESLQALGVSEESWRDYLTATLLALRGWAGMIWFLEQRPDRAVYPVPRGSVEEFLAVRLVLERQALEYIATSKLAYCGTLANLPDELRGHGQPDGSRSVEQRAFLVFQLAQVLGWSPAQLSFLTDQDWKILIEEIESFSEIRRQHVYQLAYERRFQVQVLDALSLHAANVPEPIERPRLQAFFCIDDREESIRRHLEELAPDTTTYGIAGFYFVAMYYRGVGDAHFVPLCPVAVVPQHWVIEDSVGEPKESHPWSARVRHALGTALGPIHWSGRAFSLGAFVSALGGVVATARQVARIVFPRMTTCWRHGSGKSAVTPRATRLYLERTDPPQVIQQRPIGFSLDEMAEMGERVLRDTGLTTGFAPLVLMFGHGSTSLNNPHESAQDCGACGGAQGGPSGRAIAHILNDSRVREILVRRGIAIPSSTVFVGGMHNTSNDQLVYYDVDQVPASHRGAFESACKLMERAAARNAHERCRRFRSAPLSLSLDAAREHVEGRAGDLSQVRPEWGHATNAFTFIGRRQRTRGLFLDRRVFLSSYDPTGDDIHGSILHRILQAVVPVCSGISLEYYFSYIDNTGYGSGSKLPHNITSLVGVMDGAASDLRTGLPWQTVEIHEPIRHLFVIETIEETMQQVLNHSPAIRAWLDNDWFRLAILSPTGPSIHEYVDGAFREYTPHGTHLPQAPSSADWYRGSRDHLEFAQIGGKPSCHRNGSH